MEGRLVSSVVGIFGPVWGWIWTRVNSNDDVDGFCMSMTLNSCALGVTKIGSVMSTLPALKMANRGTRIETLLPKHVTVISRVDTAFGGVFTHN